MVSAEQEAHEFTLVLDRPITGDETDQLFETTGGDAMPERATDHTLLHFARRAGSLLEAIASAVVDVEKAGLTAAGVNASDLVDLPEIASRVRRSRESIRLLAAGRRGPGDFPPAQDGFYSWVMVRAWFSLYDPEAVGRPTADDLDFDRAIAAADHVVRARALMQGRAGGLGALLTA